MFKPGDNSRPIISHKDKTNTIEKFDVESFDTGLYGSVPILDPNLVKIDLFRHTDKPYKDGTYLWMCYLSIPKASSKEIITLFKVRAKTKDDAVAHLEEFLGLTPEGVAKLQDSLRQIRSKRT